MKNKALSLFITCVFTVLTLGFLSGCATTDGPFGTQAPAPAVTDGEFLGLNNETILPGQKNIAILLPLSGKNAGLGQSMLNAAQLALFEINDPSFNLIPRDTGGTSQGASRAASEAINNGADLIIGPVFASSVRAVKPIAKSANINMIAFSTDWTLADNTTFLMGFMPFSQVNRIADYSSSKGIQSVSIIAPRDKYGDLVTNQFAEAITGNGGKINQTIRFAANDPQLGSKLNDLDKNVDAFFIPVGGQALNTITDYLEQSGITSKTHKFLGTGLWNNPVVANLDSVQGGWFAGPAPQQRFFFENLYFKTYGQQPIQISSLAFDAVALAATIAGDQTGFSTQSITNSNGFVGTDGVFRFGNNGIVQRELSILEIKNRKFEVIDSAKMEF
ncbi:MAG: penicillin-binding protein activator [Pseudomonadota bacterium]